MKKERGKKFGISNNLFYAAVVIISLILIGVGVYAYGTTNPAVMGHSAGELAPPTGCAGGSALVWTGTTWGCILLNSSMGSVSWTQPISGEVDFYTYKVGSITYLSGHVDKLLTGTKYFYSPPGIFVLSTNFHPRTQWYAVGMDAENNQVCKITIKTNGDVYISGPAGDVTCYFSTSFPTSD